MPQEPTFWLTGAGRALTESPVSLAGRRQSALLNQAFYVRIYKHVGTTSFPLVLEVQKVVIKQGLQYHSTAGHRAKKQGSFPER